jgi:hypothetical protein
MTDPRRGQRPFPPGASHRALRGAAALLVLVVLLLASARARADEEVTKQACAASYASTQEHRLAGRLRRALESARTCARRTCPAVVRDECAKWVTEIRDAIPSVVVTARGVDGRDVTDVRTFVDGELVATELRGRAIDLDPGERALRFEHGDRPPQHQTVVVAEGTKNRRVEVSFAPPEPALPDGGVEPPAREAYVPPPAIALTTIGGAALVGFAVLAAVGSKEVRDLEQSCGTRGCSEGEIAPARAKLIAGDVLLGVGIVASAFGVGWILYEQAAAGGGADSARVVVAVDGAGLALIGAF